MAEQVHSPADSIAHKMEGDPQLTDWGDPIEDYHHVAVNSTRLTLDERGRKRLFDDTLRRPRILVRERGAPIGAFRSMT